MILYMPGLSHIENAGELMPLWRAAITDVAIFTTRVAAAAGLCISAALALQQNPELIAAAEAGQIAACQGYLAEEGHRPGDQVHIFQLGACAVDAPYAAFPPAGGLYVVVPSSQDLIAQQQSPADIRKRQMDNLMTAYRAGAIVGVFLGAGVVYRRNRLGRSHEVPPWDAGGSDRGGSMV